MAGRPTSARGGQSGLLYGLIAFAVISVASLGLFIFQLTKNKAAENRAQSAEQKLRQFSGGSPAPAYYADEASARKSNVFAVMSDDLKKLATRVTGTPEDVGTTVLAKTDQVMADLVKSQPGVLNTGDNLLSALLALNGLCTKEKTVSADLTRQVQDGQREMAALTEQLKATRNEFEGQIAAVRGQLRQADDEKLSALQQKDTQLRDVQTTLDATESQLQTLKRDREKELRDKDIEIGQRETLVSDLQKQIQVLKPGGFEPSAILTKADGRILRSIPGSDVVYVNLGASDRMKPGMGFEVYSPTRQASADLRGKASLEVVTVMDDTAECRVTRRIPGQPIMEGDTVVNIAYERNRKPKFVVRGDFDLNYDGVIDYNGTEEITALIRQWGGQVVDDLDESVDYVVIGLPPTAPTAASGGKATQVVQAEGQQKDLERSQFRALVERAQKMFIPVITQNQFLFLTGYAGDTTVVQRQ
jgi:hypothetical protein